MYCRTLIVCIALVGLIQGYFSVARALVPSPAVVLERVGEAWVDITTVDLAFSVWTSSRAQDAPANAVEAEVSWLEDRSTERLKGTLIDWEADLPGVVSVPFEMRWSRDAEFDWRARNAGSERLGVSWIADRCPRAMRGGEGDPHRQEFFVGTIDDLVFNRFRSYAAGISEALQSHQLNVQMIELPGGRFRLSIGSDEGVGTRELLVVIIREVDGSWVPEELLEQRYERNRLTRSERYVLSDYRQVGRWWFPFDIYESRYQAPNGDAGIAAEVPPLELGESVSLSDLHRVEGKDAALRIKFSRVALNGNYDEAAFAPDLERGTMVSFPCEGKPYIHWGYATTQEWSEDIRASVGDVPPSTPSEPPSNVVERHSQAVERSSRGEGGWAWVVLLAAGVAAVWAAWLWRGARLGRRGGA